MAYKDSLIGLAYRDFFFFPRTMIHLSRPLQTQGLNASGSKELLPIKVLTAMRCSGIEPRPISQPNYLLTSVCILLFFLLSDNRIN